MRIEEHDIREFFNDGFDEFLASLVKKDKSEKLLRKAEGGLGKYHHPKELYLVIHIRNLKTPDVSIGQDFDMKANFAPGLAEWESLLDKLTYLAENFSCEVSAEVRLLDARGTVSTWATSSAKFYSDPLNKTQTWKNLTDFYMKNTDLFVEQW